MKKFFRVFGALLIILVISGAVYGIFNSRQILDYIALYNYDPPAEVVQIARETSMNGKTRNVFYVNQPEIQNKTAFRSSCVNQEETIVLGCYVENDGIYLLNVTDERLDGIIEVTAAHEVLHALYDRLSDEERQRIDGLTAEFFSNLKNDRIRENIENYRSRDPSVVPNELHSILGTEVRKLTPELEEYYSQYFEDRLKIVSLSEAYEQTFVKLERQVEQYKAQLDQLKVQLDSNDASIAALGQQIDSERNRLDSLLNNDQVEQYNRAVAGFNNSVEQYNGLIQQRKALIEQYNLIVGKYNDVASTEAELVDSLKSDVEQIQPAIN